MSNTIDGSSGIASLNLAELGPNTSLQLMFAALQLEMAETAKTQAMDRMDSIAKCQEEQKHDSQLLNEARQAKADAKAKDCCTPMSSDMIEYMDKNNLAYDKAGGDYIHTEEEWDVAITALESHLEQLGTSTQQEMVYVQDFMGQYNSYLQGANTQIANSNQTLTSLAKGM